MLATGWDVKPVGDQVVHRRQPGGPDVPDPAHLQRGRFASEHEQSLTGVARQVEENVDPVGADLLGKCLVAKCPCLSPGVACCPDSPGQVVGDNPVAVAEALACRTVERLERTDEESSDRVAPKSAERKPRRSGRSGSGELVKGRRSSELRGVTFLPLRMRLGQTRECHPRAVLFAEQGLAMCQGQQIRLDLQGVVVLFHGFLQPSLGMEGTGQSASGLGQPRLDRQRPPTCRFGLLEPVERLEQTSQVVLGFGTLRCDRQGALISRHRLITFPEGLIGVSQIDLRPRQARLGRQCPPEVPDRFLIATLRWSAMPRLYMALTRSGLIASARRQAASASRYRPSVNSTLARLFSVSAFPGRSASARS